MDLELRPWTKRDARALAAAIVASYDHLRPWLAWASGDHDAAGCRTFIREALAAERDGGDRAFGLLLGGRVVGAAGLHRRGGPEMLEIGYWVRADVLRRGIATAAVRRLVPIAFADPAITRLEIHHDAANEASGRVAAAAGFRLIGEAARVPVAPADGPVERIWALDRADADASAVPATIAPFVDAGWLADHRDAVVVADVRWYLDGRSGQAAYDAEHLPGAVFVDLERCLAAPADPRGGRHPLPAAEDFARAMSALGIGDGDTVVAYDDAGGVIAARLVWMLRATGHAATLLDGGIQAWDGPLEREVRERPRAKFGARPWPAGLLADADDAVADGVVLLDARPADRYAGAPDDLDPRAGHIPGARSMPCRENLDADGRLRSPQELRARLREAGVTQEADVVSSCGSGVTACHNLLVAEHVGLGAGRLFPGSWSAWSRDPSRPVATGADNGQEPV